MNQIHTDFCSRNFSCGKFLPTDDLVNDFWLDDRMKKAAPGQYCQIEKNSGRFGIRRFGKNMAADVSAKKYAETSQAKKKLPKRLA